MSWKYTCFSNGEKVSKWPKQWLCDVFSLIVKPSFQFLFICHVAIYSRCVIFIVRFIHFYCTYFWLRLIVRGNVHMQTHTQIRAFAKSMSQIDIQTVTYTKNNTHT